MSCYHPLKGFQIGLTANGKPDYKVCSYDVARVDVYVNRRSGERKIFCYTQEQLDRNYDYYVPGLASGLKRTQQISYFVELPCGHCIGCKLDYSRRWADRMMLELQYHKDAWFVTLTYNNDNVPYTVNEKTGEFGALTLCKRDFQLFMKSLRKKSGQKLRYFCAGEYGEKTLRPHFHMILYGLHLDDDQLEFYKRDPSGKFNYFKCQYLADIWDRGHVVVSKVTWETCAYTARYVTKKLQGPEADFYRFYDMEPPCSLMSRKPGIARQYYEDHPDLFRYNRIDISTDTGGRSISIPRYYDSLLEVDDPELAEDRKKQRQEMAISYRDALLKQTDLEWSEYLSMLESKKLDSVKKLKREL